MDGLTDSPRRVIQQNKGARTVEALIDQLLAGGHLGLFAAFLVWQFIALQKRLDRLVESFQSQLKDINDNYDQRLVGMRAVSYTHLTLPTTRYV